LKINEIYKYSYNNSESRAYLKEWIHKLEDKLSGEFSKIKREHPNFFRQEGINNNFTNIALELENYINSQVKYINSLFEVQFENPDDKISEKEFFKLLKYLESASDNNPKSNLEEVYEKYLIFKEIENLKPIYDMYTEKFQEINIEVIEKLKEKFILYNIKNESD
jgi:hypothetical protein